MRGAHTVGVAVVIGIMALACGGETGTDATSPTEATPATSESPDTPAAPAGDGPLCCRARGKDGEPDQFQSHSPGCSKASAVFGTGVVGADLEKMAAEKLHPFEEYRGDECEMVCCNMSSNPMEQTFGRMTRGECKSYRGEAPGRCLGVPGAQACNVSAIVADPDPAGLNVRDAPKGKTVKGQIFKGAMVTLTGSKDGWVHVTEVWDPERDMPEGWPTGWVAAKLLETFPKTKAEYGPGAAKHYYDSPMGNEKSFGGSVPANAVVKGCKDAWIDVEMTVGGKKVRGWLDQSAHCPNPVTTCP